MAIVRLPRLFEGVALDWFISKRGSIGYVDWSVWKQTIKEHFGNRIWEKKMIRNFDNDHFEPSKDKP